MGYQDSVNLTPLTEAYLDEEAKQSLTLYASAAARLADAALAAVLREGMVSVDQTANTLLVQYDATAGHVSTVGPLWGGLTTWTPTITQSAGVTKTVNYATYIRLGRLIIAWAHMSVTGSGTANNLITVSMPVSAASSQALPIGSGYITDASATTTFQSTCHLASTAAFYFTPSSGAGTVSDAGIALGNGTSNAALQFGLANTDVVAFHIIYEAASDA